MRLLVDNDAFSKLALAGLLHDTARLFGAKLHDCGRLASLPYMLRRGKLQKMLGAANSNFIQALTDDMPVIGQPNLGWFDKLTAVDAIDSGEAQIFSVAADSDAYVLTGDKRALCALKNIQEFVNALHGRIVTLEAILIALCDSLGEEEVRHRVRPVTDCDTMVRLCFSTGNPKPIEALFSYYNSSVADVTPLVLWNPRPRGIE